MPSKIRVLPVDDRGYPVPWFVARVDGVWDFRVVHPGRFREAYQKDLCWICGQRSYLRKAFVIGPMCAINRVSSEPPSHPECAMWAAIACPFLARPKSVRRTAGLPSALLAPAGMKIERNPGVTLVWIVKGYTVERHADGILFRLPDPLATQWFAEGREATRAEVEASIDSGYPLLESAAQEDGPEAVAELQECKRRAAVYLPA